MSNEELSQEEKELLASMIAEDSDEVEVETEYHEDPIIESIPTAIISEKLAEEIDKMDKMDIAKELTEVIEKISAKLDEEKSTSPIQAFRDMTEVGNQTGKRIG